MRCRLSLLGTPNDDTWPGVTGLPDYKTTFPNWHAKNLGDHIPGSNSKSIELIAVCLRPLLFCSAEAGSPPFRPRFVRSFTESVAHVYLLAVFYSPRRWFSTDSIRHSPPPPP
jgi:hypothetical protein